MVNSKTWIGVDNYDTKLWELETSHPGLIIHMGRMEGISKISWKHLYKQLTQYISN